MDNHVSKLVVDVDIAKTAMLILCKSVDSATAREIPGKVMFGSSLKIQIDPSQYTTSRAFALDYALSKYLSKYKGAADQAALTVKAYAGFRETELAVRDTNLRLTRSPCKNGVDGVILHARRKIRSILGCRCRASGPCSCEFPFEEFAKGCDWGKGATSSLLAKDATLDKKILEPFLSVTPEALPLAKAYLRYDVNMFQARLGRESEIVGPYCVSDHEFSIVPGGRISTADKDSETRRTIDIQPTMNLFLQKGLGALIRRCLKRVGINLDDQSRNQKLAGRAQQDALATLDLAKASDTVCYALVRELLPPHWFEILDMLRTKFVCMDGGEWLRLEKFSSMGNGFTFELETLIFYALSWAVVRIEDCNNDGEIAVYGDDIIVPQSSARRVAAVLEEVGFEVNETKSFYSGRFFESCGKHYFDGVDVTPPYQKEVVCDLSSSVRAANRLFRWAYRVGKGWFLDRVAVEAWSFYVNQAESYFEAQSGRARHPAKPCAEGVSTSRRIDMSPRLPLQPWWLEGDGALLVNFEPQWSIHGTAHLWMIKDSPGKVRADHDALLAHSLRKGCVVDTPYKGMLSLRGVSKQTIVLQKVSRHYGSVPKWY